MCDIRLISELNLRPDPPHPMQMKHRERVRLFMFLCYQIRWKLIFSELYPYSFSICTPQHLPQ